LEGASLEVCLYNKDNTEVPKHNIIVFIWKQ